MKWIYKNIEIEINSEGRFFFNVRGKDFSTTSLDEAKEIISKALAFYYTFTQKDMDKLLSKLDSREKELVKSLYQELDNHKGNNYCELGICQKEWNWEWDFNK
jgi:hypothetical protein